jgi:hypothetical protein
LVTTTDERELRMGYAFMQDIPVSWAEYQPLETVVRGPGPRGLIVHTAGPIDEGVRIIEVWESEEAWRSFRAEALTALLPAPGPAPVTTFRDLHVVHLLRRSSEASATENDLNPSRSDRVTPRIER